jgi:hypothetical protein
VRACDAAIDLGEYVENLGQYIGRDSNSSVSNSDYRLSMFVRNGQPNVATFRRVLGRKQ